MHLQAKFQKFEKCLEINARTDCKFFFVNTNSSYEQNKKKIMKICVKRIEIQIFEAVHFLYYLEYLRASQLF